MAPGSNFPWPCTCRSPNNTFTSATPIPSGDIQLTLSTFDVDYFFMPLNAGDGMLVRAQYDAGLGEVALTTYDAEQNLIDAVDLEGGGGVAFVQSVPAPQATAVAPGIYLELSVLNGTCIPVSLTVSTVAGGICVASSAGTSAATTAPHTPSSTGVSSDCASSAKSCTAVAK